MNEGDKNSENNDYDQESFDNESSSSISFDGSILAESSGHESFDGRFPINSSAKGLSDSFYDLSIRSLDGTKFPSKTSQSNQKLKTYRNTELFNKNQQIRTKKVQNHDFQKESSKSVKPNFHEIDESLSEEDRNEKALTKNLKSLYIEHEECSLEVVVPKRNQNFNMANNRGRNANKTIYHKTTSEIEFFVRSKTPSSFNSDNFLYEMQMARRPTCSNNSIPQRNANRKSLSFSNERMREIERHNQILLRKILSQKPSKECIYNKKKAPANHPTTTSAVNRKKQQRQIDLDNQILKRKIEAIAVRRRPNF